MSDYGKGAWTANGLKSRRDNYNVLSFNEMAREYSGLDLQFVETVGVNLCPDYIRKARALGSR